RSRHGRARSLRAGNGRPPRRPRRRPRRPCARRADAVHRGAAGAHHAARLGRGLDPPRPLAARAEPVDDGDAHRAPPRRGAAPPRARRARQRRHRRGDEGAPLAGRDLLRSPGGAFGVALGGFGVGRKVRTQVGIIGAGPAGLMLSHLLHRAGIESVVLENRSRDYIESRIRAGLIEQWASDLLVETGVGDRMRHEGMFHDGVYFAFGGALHYINFRELVGKGVTIYGQQEVIKDLIERRLAEGGTILFEASDVSIHDFAGRTPKIRFRHEGRNVGGTRKLAEGPMLQKGITAMRSFVVEPMQYGRLFLARDSAHIQPPPGAKGMNLALADVSVLARAIAEFYRTGRSDLLERYSATCLRRVWKAQRFSWWMTQLFHLDPTYNAFDRKRQ